MKIPFTKMQGSGNDYIYLNCMEGTPGDPGALSRELSRRHFSVGADGLVLILPPSRLPPLRLPPLRADAEMQVDAEMRMFNSDGSEGNICGNALCCVGKYLFDSGIARKTELCIGTRSGVRRLWLFPESGSRGMLVRVEMGRALFAPESVPLRRSAPMIGERMCIGGREVCVTSLSVGNPHAVVFTDAAEVPEPETFGLAMEHSLLFPAGVNTEVVCPVSPEELSVRVYERGSGETLACGSGACATAAAAVATGVCPVGREIRVRFPGGILRALCTAENQVFLTGRAETVYEGVYEYADPIE